MSEAQDPILILLQRLSESQVEHGRKQDNATNELHETRRTLDVLAARLEPLTGLPVRLSAVETLIARHDDKIGENRRMIDGHGKRIVDLESASSIRKGWETPGGKLIYLIAGTALAGFGALIGLLFRP